MRSAAVLVAGVALALGTRSSYAQKTIRRADIDSTGELRIVLSDSRIVSPPKDSDQVAFEQLALSADHRIVGWVARYPNCCTTYPIPLKLVVLRAEGHRTVISNGMPIWQWAFAADGQSVVIRQAPVHGYAPELYERRDITTGRVIATAFADSTHRELPAWARAAQPGAPLVGRWQYRQPPDREGDVLDLSYSSGQWRGIMNGLLRAGEHGVLYYVAEIENFSVDPDGVIHFEIGERRLSTKRPALSALDSTADVGVDRYRMQFTGRVEAGDLVVKCADPKGGSCLAASMRFTRM